MNLGYIKVAAGSCAVRVADCEFNRTQVVDAILHYAKNNVEVIFFPELCVTGATCGDLFLQITLLNSALSAVDFIAKATQNIDIISFIGFPFVHDGSLYSCMASIYKGKILGIVPSSNCSFTQFSSWAGYNTTTVFNKQSVPFGCNLLFKDTAFNTAISCIINNFNSLSTLPILHANANTDIMGFSCADAESADSLLYRRTLISAQSKQLNCGVALALAGEGESTTDNVYAGYCNISQNGDVLCETPLFSKVFAVADIDIDLIKNKRLLSMNKCTQDDFDVIEFELNHKPYFPCKNVARNPFLPKNEIEYAAFFERAFAICAHGLAKRMAHTNSRTAIIGISGGLDSTLALLTTVKAFNLLGLPLEQLIAVTLPCFGTSDQTMNNAKMLCAAFNISLKEINIASSVASHFEDIGQSADNHDVTFENAQARMRTLVLMDMANQNNGLVIGTGDLSELALGWATYNGDHMSMFSVNAGIPKTMVKLMIAHVAKNGNELLSAALNNVLLTPISPELLPTNENKISQITEDIVGPYELHDFFIYYVIKCKFAPKKVYALAVNAFKDDYSQAIIHKWLTSFYRRFFAQQYKRSCMPDGPQVFDISFSPRGGLLMPSDAVCKEWLSELDEIKG